MTEDQKKNLVETDPDFIDCKRFDYSLKKLEERYEDGAPDRVTAQALMMEESEVPAYYEFVVERLRAIMRIKVDE